MPGFFYLFSEASPSRVLALRPGSASSRARLDLCLHEEGASRQLWRLDSSGRLVSKFRSTSCLVSSAGAEGGAKIKVGQVSAPAKHQAWRLEEVSGGAVLLVAAASGLVVDVAADSDLREALFLARWRSEPGLVQLKHAVCHADDSAPTLILQRLGKQLGPGVSALESTDCVLRDIYEARLRALAPPEAAQQLLAAACFLRRMHLDGYVHNDLHGGNILRNGGTDSSPFSVIDLGATCEAGDWKSHLGMGCGSGWSITRDWRAFALHFVSLIDGEDRDIFKLIGTMDELPSARSDWAVQQFVSVAARAATGSRSQKWTIDRGTGHIVSRSNGKVLDLSGMDFKSVITFKAHENGNQRWRVANGVIENPESGLLVTMSDAQVVARRPTGDASQCWRYDELSGEIVHVTTRKVLDMAGEVRVPKDARHILEAAKAEQRPVLEQLFTALFSARADPNEICTLLGLLANLASVAPGPSRALAVPQPRPEASLPRGRGHEPWRGVNLGGWLLLEPGPSTGFFGRHLRRNGTEARCEWDLMEILAQRGELAALQRHRETHITKQDFIDIKQMGLNAVRLPFGYWVVTGPRRGEPYQGPALEFIDRALDWAEEVGLQVVLDLHGCPGGESHDAPCGHRVRPKSKWSWKQWNFNASLKVLERVALRYRGRRCVTGLQVCNEPSSEVPAEQLARYYDRAVATIRQAGMSADRVAVILPIFQREAKEVADAFAGISRGRHQNYCFDMHYYYCFDWWNDKNFGETLKGVDNNRVEELNQYPAVVGEWSLALGSKAWNCRCLPKKELRALFWKAQRVAYAEASHGWFFWTWKDSNSDDWDWRVCYTVEEGAATCAAPPVPLAPPAAAPATPPAKARRCGKGVGDDDSCSDTSEVKLPRKRKAPEMSLEKHKAPLRAARREKLKAERRLACCCVGLLARQRKRAGCAWCATFAIAAAPRRRGQAKASSVLVVDAIIDLGRDVERPSKRRR